MRARILPIALAIGIGTVASVVVPGMAQADVRGFVRKESCRSVTSIAEHASGLSAAMSAPGAGCGSRVQLTCYRPDGTSVVRDTGADVTGGYTENKPLWTAVKWPINYCTAIYRIRTAAGETAYAQENYYPSH